MIKLAQKSDCCGCASCSDICPAKSIVMQPDKEGFLYPHIDVDACINCGLCEKACPVITPANEILPQQVIALQLKNEDDLLKSQSGGAFWAIATVVLADGGLVYGAAFNDALRVVHQRADSLAQAEKFRGSKYVQSDTTGIFARVKLDLQSDKKVLFSGTACQCAGLKSFLGKNYDNLLLCDLVCHGTPTPLLLEKYLEYWMKKQKADVQSFEFRHYGDDGRVWGSHSEQIKFTNETIVSSKQYADLFYFNSFLRPFCHRCPYASTERISDITVADCWGAEQYTSSFECTKGVSVLFVNTAKARGIIEKIQTLCKVETVALDMVKKYQVNLDCPSKVNKHRKKMMRMLIQKDFKAVYQAYRRLSAQYRLKTKVKSWLCK
jgi:coenzyme F420-reducing hydrogenase beta subunit